jgi:outer membrane protein TolC
LPAATSEPIPHAPESIENRCETLTDAWATAVATSQALRAKRWDVSSAEHSLRSAEALRWPSFDVEGSYSLRDNEPSFRFDTAGLPLTTDTFPYRQAEGFAFRARAGLPLYNGGRISHAVAAAGAEIGSAQLAIQTSTADLKLRVAERYVAVLRAEREVELARSTVRSLEAHLRDVKLRHQHDQVPVNDLLAAQVALADARQNAIRAHNGLDASRAAYNRHLGRPLTQSVRIAELPLAAAEDHVDALTARALSRRPVLARLATQAAALEHRARSLRAGSDPQVELRGEYAFEENRFQSPQGIGAIGLGVTWNVFDAGRNHHAAAALADKAKGLRRLRADLESAIALDVRRAWLHVHETRQRLQVTAEAIGQAEENLRVARKRYTSGVGVNTEVLDAETLRSRAHRNHHGATCDAVLAIIRLQHATGELAG